MADNLAVKDAGGTGRAIATKEIAPNIHLYKQLVVNEAGAAQDLEAALALLAPASDVVAVVPSDSTTLSGVRALYVGTGGNLTITLSGHDVVLANVPDGSTLPIRGVTKVKAATTASDIVALK